MKRKPVLYILVAASMLFAVTAKAQMKVGYFDEQLILQLFPDIGRVDSLVKEYQADSIGGQYTKRVTEYQRMDSAFSKDSAKMTPQARQQALNDIMQKKNILTNWLTFAQQLSEAKTNQLLLPYRQKIYDALKAVVAEQKYTCVVDASVISPYGPMPILDNLSIRAAMKLKLPLTREIENAWKAAGTPGTKAPATKAPAPKK